MIIIFSEYDNKCMCSTDFMIFQLNMHSKSTMKGYNEIF